ncbi:MAG: ribosome biogenesis GTP-binding protein YihA/YsxC [Lachnospiraceae bacterium]|nr:ribosome biogenesis GTP-binding protein YihA/YsxC [Lachnospiraceae bacterium]
MKIKSAELETVCGITSRLPENTLPEVAFAGKSNVGKSSLINGLLNRKNLARTSSQPGKTQTINFYNVNGALYFVDLPGYGYASAAKEIREKWGRMIERYLHSSKQLRAVFLLLDIRHAPSANDCQMYDWILSQGYRPIIIATKLDKINRSQIQKQLKLLRETLKADKETLILPFSALSKQGREEIYALLDEILGVPDEADKAEAGPEQALELADQTAEGPGKAPNASE